MLNWLCFHSIYGILQKKGSILLGWRCFVATIRWLIFCSSFGYLLICTVHNVLLLVKNNPRFTIRQKIAPLLQWTYTGLASLFWVNCLVLEYVTCSQWLILISQVGADLAFFMQGRYILYTVNKIYINCIFIMNFIIKSNCLFYYRCAYILWYPQRNKYLLKLNFWHR